MKYSIEFPESQRPESHFLRAGWLFLRAYAESRRLISLPIRGTSLYHTVQAHVVRPILLPTHLWLWTAPGHHIAESPHPLALHSGRLWPVKGPATSNNKPINRSESIDCYP